MEVSRNLVSAPTTVLAASGLGAIAMLLGAPHTTAAVKINTTATGSHIIASSGDSGVFNSVYLDVDGDGSVDAWFLHVSSRWFYMTMTNSLEFAATKLPGGRNYAERFPTPPGTTTLAGHTSWDVAASVFDAGGGTGWGSWSNGMGYIGVRIHEGGGVWSYAWIQITPNATGTEIAFNDWTGAVSASGGGAAGGGPGGATGTPEPASCGLALLALGAAGVARRKRQRQVA